jgi:hypothetical protein
MGQISSTPVTGSWEESIVDIREPPAGEFRWTLRVWMRGKAYREDSGQVHTALEPMLLTIVCPSMDTKCMHNVGTDWGGRTSPT